MNSEGHSFFITGGTLPPDAPSYVERPADRQLFDALVQGEFCYVLTSRQMGKSSLMVRTANRLRAGGIKVVVLDLTAIGANVTPDQWYDGLTNRIARLLRLEDEVEDFWSAQHRLGPLQRMFAALHQLVLPRLSPGAAGPAAGNGPPPATRLVIFVDEIDMVRSLPFTTDEFFAAIRECYNRRVEEPEFKQLTFCLLGVATPSELIRDPFTTPFNIGQRIELTDFGGAEAAPLCAGWRCGEGTPARTREEEQVLLERILHWTGGHPYLTQRLSRAIAANPGSRQPEEVDRLCGDLFFVSRAREQEDNLLYVRERILRSDRNLSEVLKLYQAVWSGETVRDDEGNKLIDPLRLSGIVRVERGLLVVRNPIYHRVFDRDWIRANLPPHGAAECSSIAVLPFRVIGPDTRYEYLADGLTDELINALGRVDGLRVASRTSAFEFKGKTEDIRRIAAQLGVQHLLEGSLRQAGTDVHITAQLAQAADGHCIWSGTYRYSHRDLLEIQDQIATAIIGKLPTELRYRPQPASSARPVERTEAYNLYLKGRFHWNRRTEGAIRRSIELFEAAIQKDPSCAAAHAGLADAFNILGTYNYAPPREAYPRAKAAAHKALDLDPGLAQAHCALACARSVHDWDWAGAEAAFRQAIELNPSYATAHHWYAVNCLSPLARHDEALAALRQAQEVDPLSISIAASLGITLFLAQRNEEALEQCRQAVELDPTFWVGQLFLAWCCTEQNLFEEAIAALEASLRFGNNDPVALAALAHALASSGRRTECQQRLDELHRLAETRYVPAIDLVPVYLALDDTETAFHWLDRAYEERSFKLIYLRVDPRLKAVSSHPRLTAIRHAIGLGSPGISGAVSG